LLQGAQGRAVCDIDASEAERATPIIAATGVELGAVIRECEKVPVEQGIETGAGRAEMRAGLGRLSGNRQRVGKAPVHLRVAACKRRREQRFGFVCPAFR
jgi:hypothetical protein